VFEIKINLCSILSLLFFWFNGHFLNFISTVVLAVQWIQHHCVLLRYHPKSARNSWLSVSRQQFLAAELPWDLGDQLFPLLVGYGYQNELNRRLLTVHAGLVVNTLKNPWMKEK